VQISGISLICTFAALRSNQYPKGVEFDYRKEDIDMPKKIEVPVWEKSNLTLEEAAQYFNIGMNKIRDLTNEDRCPFVLWIGSRRLVKRVKFEEYLNNQYSV
jgi:excisionase family DNA binding protein